MLLPLARQRSGPLLVLLPLELPLLELRPDRDDRLLRLPEDRLRERRFFFFFFLWSFLRFFVSRFFSFFFFSSR